MSLKWNQGRPLLGYSDTETVKLDFDEMPFKDVKYWALRTMKWFKLGGFLNLKSSKNCYHVVFNRKVSWRKNVHIVAWVCLESQNQGLDKWFVMQCIKESSTLRVSPKNDKPSPRIVYHEGKQDGQIKVFLANRRCIKDIIRKMQKLPPPEEWTICYM